MKSLVSLCMGISDKIEVSTIAIDKTTILEIKPTNKIFKKPSLNIKIVPVIYFWTIGESLFSTRMSLASLYSQLSRKRPPLVQEKVVAHERWSPTGTINKISSELYASTNNNCYIKLLPILVKIRRIDKTVSIKINPFWVLQHVLCFVNALANLIAFEFGKVLLVKSTETALTVLFSRVSC